MKNHRSSVKASDREFFSEHGYIIYKNAVTNQTIAKLVDCYKNMLIDILGGNRDKTTYDLIFEAEELGHHNIYNCSKAMGSSIVVSRLTEDLGVAEKANALKQWDESSLHTTLFQCPVQFPSDGRFDFQWHQENGSYDLLPDLLTFWFPLLHKTSATSGGMELIPGSHKQGVLQSKHIIRESKLNEWVVEVSEEQEADKLIVEIEVGDVVCFDANLIHRSISVQISTAKTDRNSASWEY